MAEVKAVFTGFRYQWVLNPLNGPIELFFKDENSDARYSDCVPKGTCINDTLIEEMRERAAVGMAALLIKRPDQPIEEKNRMLLKNHPGVETAVENLCNSVIRAALEIIHP